MSEPGPKRTDLHPQAMSIYDIRDGKLPDVWLLALPTLAGVVVVFAMLRDIKRRKRGGSPQQA